MKLVSKILEVNSSLNNAKEKNKTKSYQPKLGLEIGQIQKGWANIVGDGFLLKHTVPIRIDKNELHVVTDHPSLLEQSAFMKRILNQKFGQETKTRFFKIKNVNFIFNTKLFVQHKSLVEKVFAHKKRELSFHPFSPEYKSLKKKAEKEFQFLDDETLKKKLVSLFIQKSCYEKGSKPN